MLTCPSGIVAAQLSDPTALLRQKAEDFQEPLPHMAIAYLKCAKRRCLNAKLLVSYCFAMRLQGQGHRIP